MRFFFSSGFDTYQGKSSSTRSLKSELDKYLEEEKQPRKDPNFNVLIWWQGVGLRYPTLRKIARDILAVPISTVASESVFSTGGRVVTPHQSRLHPKTLEGLMCSQSWLLKDVKGQGNQILLNEIYILFYDIVYYIFIFYCSAYLERCIWYHFL